MSVCEVKISSALIIYGSQGANRGRPAPLEDQGVGDCGILRGHPLSGAARDSLTSKYSDNIISSPPCYDNVDNVINNTGPFFFCSLWSLRCYHSCSCC
ncbi:hypothetical protein ElyMa_002123100 [Elysia marginata]|uniref:Uncharacterized protein n=1 Tax=Elysia marginata TaxID=1093978 RepID=A0AAV4FJI1_9GAST|nr:hypothetical protein ElyMa_002123100 [Elysia marginata]